MQEKIEKQKKEVIAARERYDTATAQLMDRLEAIEKYEIIKAFSKSVMAFLRSDSQDDQNEE